jgi:hypothetical protein
MTFTRLPTPDWITEIPSKTSITGKRLYEVSPGLWYPSITTVIGAEPEKVAALEAWRQSYGVDRAKERTDKAAERGTTVHDHLDDYLNGKDVVLDKDTVDVIVRAPYNQIKRELNAHLTEIVVNEVPLYSHLLKTAGRVDLIGSWDGKRSIIDFKTADKKKTEQQIEGYFLQTTAYALCWYEMCGELIEDIVVIIGNEKLFKPQIFRKTIYPYIRKVEKLFDDYHTRTGKK